MYKKLLLCISLLIVQQTIFSQNKPRLIKGFVKDSLGVVVDANVLNLKTLEGTFTSEYGVFEILASKGDSIQISSVPHVGKRIKITEENYKLQQIEIVLKIDITILDEIELKQNSLIGILDLDAKKAPLKKRDSIFEDNLDYIKNAKKGNLEPDFIDTNVKPPENNVDPTSNFVGAGATINMSNPLLKKERAKKAYLAYRTAFPKILLNDLGEDFFFVKLKIPKERYYHFLEYCNPLGIEELYRKNKKLEVIKILKKEHIGYLKIISEE